MAQNGHVGDPLLVSLQHTPDYEIAARATAAQLHHFGVGGGLVNEGRLNMLCSCSQCQRARATSARSRPAAQPFDRRPG
jgi:hypothetical protein